MLRYFVLSILIVLDVGAKTGFRNAKQRQGYKYHTFFERNNALPDFGTNAVYLCPREKNIKPSGIIWPLIVEKWIGDEPWSAELDRCDENWEHIPDSPDYVNLLEEKDHTPGTVKGYYYDEEYPFLMERVLEIVREMKPELKDQLI